MPEIFIILILVILIIIIAFFEVMVSVGTAGVNPSKIISEIFKKKPDKTNNLLTKTPVPFSEKVTIDDSSKKITEPVYSRSIMRWRTTAGVLMGLIMTFLLAFWRPALMSGFYPWIYYTFWPVLFITIFVFIILWKKEKKFYEKQKILTKQGRGILC